MVGGQWSVVGTDRYRAIKRKMTILERLKIGYAAFRGTLGVELPASGRSSEETISGAMSAYLASFDTVSPVVDFEMLKVLKNFWIYNPDFSQYVANIVNLGNPGHQLSVDARTDAAAEAAVNRLNESASRIYEHGCGVDGLINQYLTSVAWSGAVSSEDVVNLPGRRVEKVVLVPVEQIRFKYDRDTDTYRPFQKSFNILRRNGSSDPLGLVPLNAETYRYFALSTVENSPYAKPPATGAIEAILEMQKPLMDNLKFVATKFGLLGLVTASLVAPRRNPSGETEAEYTARCVAYRSSVTKALESGFKNGLLVTFRDQKIEHTNLAEGASGLYDANRISEEQVFSGLGAMPGFHGRTDSTTETFADVVYYLLTAQVQGMQRIVKRRMERTYRLDLMLGGADVIGVSLAFDKAHSRNAKAEAETDEIHFRTVLSKLKNGAISPDQAAQEIGEEAWFDTDLLISDAGIPAKTNLARSTKQTRTLKLSFDKRQQKYVYRPEVIELANFQPERIDTETVVPFVKKKALPA